jgi:hypothetical protein
MVTWRSRAVAAVATAVTALAVAALVGCAPAPEPPRPATPEEIEAFAREMSQEWWDSIAPGEPMPEVDVIEVLPADESSERQTECIRDAEIPGLTVTPDGGITFSVETSQGDPLDQAVQQQFWICAAKYPMEDDYSWVMSESELAWTYDFYVERYRPCLSALGFEFQDFPDRGQFVDGAVGYLAWIPHDYSIAPTPSAQQWNLIAARCPLPPLLDTLGLPASGTAD